MQWHSAQNILRVKHPQASLFLSVVRRSDPLGIHQFRDAPILRNRILKIRRLDLPVKNVMDKP